MIDIVDKQTRSRMMSGIRAKNTKPELLMRKMLHRRGFRFRLNVKTLPGKPDIVLPKHNAIIFVHGCFWHGHGCRLFKWPSTRREFWQEKIRKNIRNDQKSNSSLLAMGWRIAVIWECSIKSKSNDSNQLLFAKIVEWLESNSVIGEFSE